MVCLPTSHSARSFKLPTSMLLLGLAGIAFSTSSFSAAFTPLWETLPATPHLPGTIGTGYVNTTEGASIWYGVFGRELSETARRGGTPVLFLHGGFANSDYWGYQIAALNDVRRTILAIDTRGHGRSLDGTELEMTYDLIANDTVAVLDHLNVSKVVVVGWSDGGITGLNLAMNYSSRVDRVFAFAASYNPDNIPDSIVNSTVFDAFLSRSMTEYTVLNPEPAHFPMFEQKMNAMWSTEPQWDAVSFAHVLTPYASAEAPLIRIVDADHDEAIALTTPLQLQEWIPASGRTILPDVSHFA